MKKNTGTYTIINEEILKEKRKVTVITPVYNTEKYLKTTIDSVIKQNIGFSNNISYILVDDCSQDGTRAILKEYAEIYKNITVVLLNENTGSPAMPRNIGIELANSEYVLFLDADDWLSPIAIKTLSDILDETNDNYVVGKTIHVNSDSSKVIAKHESIKERRKVKLNSIKYIFRHLGPRARMIRLDVIKKNNIKFPEMRYSEDKQFFIDVLLHCETISTTEKVIYYLNRYDENNSSLVNQTDIFEKMDTNISVINYVIDKRNENNIEKSNRPDKFDFITRLFSRQHDKTNEDDIEKLILNRLYEFDCITRLFFRQHFLKCENKELYYEKYNEVLNTAEKLDYNIEDIIYNPVNKVVHELFIEKNYDKMIELIEYELGKVKKYTIKDNEPYLIGDFLPEKYRYIKLPILAVFRCAYLLDNNYVIEADVYGEDKDNIEFLILDKRSEYYDEKGLHNYKFNIEKVNNERIKIKFELDKLSEMHKGKYKVFIRYNDYEDLYIKVLDETEVNCSHNKIKFYKTIKSNIGFVIE